jgi:hypothetical protein
LHASVARRCADARGGAQGTLPIWPTWNGRSDEMSTRNIFISAFAGAKLGDVGFLVRSLTRVHECAARSHPAGR